MRKTYSTNVEPRTVQGTSDFPYDTDTVLIISVPLDLWSVVCDVQHAAKDGCDGSGRNPLTKTNHIECHASRVTVRPFNQLIVYCLLYVLI